MTIKAIKGIARTALALYLALMLWLLFFRHRAAYDTYCLQPIPFADIIRLIRTLLHPASPTAQWQAVVQLLGNIIMFVPIGFFMPACVSSPARFSRFLAAFWCFDLAVELAQLITRRGVCDVDDILLNTLGACIGFFCFRCIARKSKSPGEFPS